MDKMINKTVGVLSRLGEGLERRFSTGDSDDYYIPRSGSNSMFPGTGSAFHRPFGNDGRSSPRDLIYGDAGNYSSDNLAASPGYSSFNNYRQNPSPNPYVDGFNRPPYGPGFGGPGSYPRMPGRVGYAPDYYIAERRQLELVPAPRPQIIRQPVPVPYPVDRPVPQPYPVNVPTPFPVDRPVPVPVPSPVPYDRPVPFPVPVPVRSPPPPPVCVPVPTAVPCYVPVGVPVPSPRASPVMFQQSFSQSQSWSTSSGAYPFYGGHSFVGF